MPFAKRRILFLVTTADWGGVQFFVHALAIEASHRGFDVMVAAGGVGELETRCQESHLAYTRLQHMRREISPFSDLAALHELRRLYRSFKPDIVHLNSSKMGVLGSFAAHIEKVPRVIYRIGGWSFLEPQSRFTRWIYETAERTTAPYKDVIVTVHPGDEQIAQTKKILPRRLITIPNGIDLATFDAQLLSRARARQQLGLDPNALVIGTIGNFYPPKNIPWLIETIAAMRETNPSVIPAKAGIQWIIIGDGPERSKVESIIARHHLKSSVILAGRLPNAASLLSAFDLFVLPSTKEGMPWSLLEAMAARLPCIATDVGACRWMLELDAGVIVPTNDREAFSKSVAELVNDASRRQTLGEHARHIVSTRFQWKTTMEESIKLFE